MAEILRPPARWVFHVLVFLYPLMLSAQPLETRVLITSVKVGNSVAGGEMKELTAISDSVIQLSYAHNNLFFSFQDRKNPENRTFYYYMVGLDYAWSQCEDCSQMYYAHLSGGDYSFLVKTREDETPAEFKFFVEGDILHKWWFVPMLFMYLFVLAGVGIYFFVLHNFRQNLREERRVHQEKMASMADLTDGIAHEIMNPLNFVNNYSEVSGELVDEIVAERTIPSNERDEKLIDELLVDLNENLKKIYLHGKRADVIVSGMLKHGQRSTGLREPTNLNTLLAQSLQNAMDHQLTLNGAFQVAIQTHYQETLPEVELVVAEISQVVHNILGNAFYAMNERFSQEPENYRPLLTIMTLSKNSHVEVHIRDNATGISKANLDRVFQPFFTTKPTGQGTGLGLSLAYETIKAHGGEISAQSIVGVGSLFVIELPC